jgi:hypothetical protein
MCRGSALAPAAYCKCDLKHVYGFFYSCFYDLAVSSSDAILDAQLPDQSVAHVCAPPASTYVKLAMQLRIPSLISQRRDVTAADLAPCCSAHVTHTLPC